MILIDDENVLGIEYKSWDNMHGLWVDITEDIGADFLCGSYDIVEVGESYLKVRKVKSCNDILNAFKDFWEESPMQPFDYCGDHDKVKDRMDYKIEKAKADLETQLLDLNNNYRESF